MSLHVDPGDDWCRDFSRAIQTALQSPQSHFGQRGGAGAMRAACRILSSSAERGEVPGGLETLYTLVDVLGVSIDDGDKGRGSARVSLQGLDASLLVQALESLGRMGFAARF